MVYVGWETKNRFTSNLFMLPIGLDDTFDEIHLTDDSRKVNNFFSYSSDTLFSVKAILET